jgi:hypothetical protein
MNEKHIFNDKNKWIHNYDTKKIFQKKWEKSKIRKREKFKLEKKFLFCSYSETRLDLRRQNFKIKINSWENESI